jgi:hypothetical protein
MMYPRGMSLELTVPSGAVAFSVDFNFYTSEFPSFVCASFNDFDDLVQVPPSQPTTKPVAPD